MTVVVATNAPRRARRRAHPAPLPEAFCYTIAEGAPGWGTWEDEDL